MEELCEIRRRNNESEGISRGIDEARRTRAESCTKEAH
jgi:hypothetical protein